MTFGDVRGIGPEVVYRGLEQLGPVPEGFILVGPPEMDRGTHPFRPVSAPSSDPGRAAGESIELATQLALDGDVDGVVTAPIHKPSLVEAGYDFPGHTEMLQALSKAPSVGMLMCHEVSANKPGGALRVLLATTHIALRDVAAALTTELLVEQTNLLARSLMADWGIRRPRLALCALNPHASDGGLFGDEEERIYAPALDAVGNDAWSTDGPIPADTVFHRARSGEFDAVVAPYHDVGMAAFKTASFGRGVNVTLGLPFVRTSPDHGTAFAIAGKNVADASSMEEALRLGRRLAERRWLERLSATTQ